MADDKTLTRDGAFMEAAKGKTFSGDSGRAASVWFNRGWAAAESVLKGMVMAQGQEIARLTSEVKHLVGLINKEDDEAERLEAEIARLKADLKEACKIGLRWCACGGAGEQTPMDADRLIELQKEAE